VGKFASCASGRLCGLMAVCGFGLAMAFLAVLASGPASAAVPAPVPGSALAANADPAPLAFSGLAHESAPLPMPGTSFAATTRPGTGGWYWPVGTEDFGGASGWLDDRGWAWHVAQDMPAGYGHPVYAIGAGVVWKVKTDALGYGPGWSPGGVMIIIHTTATGQEFRALYGHIMGIRYREGQRVAAGAVIAQINGCSHLHFGIHPSAKYPDNNPYRGNAPKSWRDYGGWVDPVKFLKTHWRVIPYSPPPLPVLKVVTAGAPTDVVAAAGAIYWTEQTVDGAVTYRRDLTTGARRILALGEVVPAPDRERYVVKVLTGAETGFTVSDRLPVIAFALPRVTPPWGVAVRFAARLTNLSRRPFQGGRVQLERLSGGTWYRVAASVTLSDGRVSFVYTPLRRTALRLRFLPPATQAPSASYERAVGVTVTLTPHVRLTIPAGPATVARGRSFTVAGLVTPRHSPAARSIRLEFQRLTDGAWVVGATITAAIRNDATGCHYLRAVRLHVAGRWRVRAVHLFDTAHAETAGGWRAFTVV
jgi:hypothetical protein